MFAQRQKGGALGLFLGRKFFPFRTTDRAEKNRVRGATGFERRIRQGFAVIINANPADVVRRMFERMT